MTSATDGIGYIQLGENQGQVALDTVNGVVTQWGTKVNDCMQASGVLIAPDEILTAAHVVNAADGGQRTIGSVSIGYTSGNAVDGKYDVAGVHSMTSFNFSQGTNVPVDLAIIHLATPVASGQLFQMSSQDPTGPATASGYPAILGGVLNTTQQMVTSSQGDTVLTTGELGSVTDPHGESGGPLYSVQNGQPVVYGITSTGDATEAQFVHLTDADIAWVKSQVTADHNGADTTLPAISGGTLGGGQTMPAPIDSLLSLASTIAGDAGSYPKMHGVMNNVAAGLQQAYADGNTGNSFAATALDLFDILQNGSTPQRGVAYAAGLYAAEEGNATKSGAMAFVKSIIGGFGGNTALKNAALSGYAEGETFYSAHNAASPTASFVIPHGMTKDA